MAILQVSQMLPLQLWDGQYGALNILPKSFDREVLCKTFTVAALGVFQPFLLLLAGFLCTHALRCALKDSAHCTASHHRFCACPTCDSYSRSH